MPWRRLADWKNEVHLVDLADVDDAFLESRGLTHPVGALLARWPDMAAALERTRHVRVDEELVAALHAAGVPTIEIGYHRGAEGLSYADRGPGGEGETHVDLAELVGDLDEHELSIDDAVDAVLRIYSEGLLTEKAVLVAAVVPTLGGTSQPADESVGLEHLDPAELPEVDEAVVDRVAALMSVRQDATPTGVRPDLTVEQRRGYQKQAAVAGVVGLGLVAASFFAMPMLAVLGAPVLALAAIVFVVHEAVIRQQAGQRAG